VALNLDSPEKVCEAYRALLERVSAALPAVESRGVLLQPFLAGGQEVIVGMVRDAQFGPLVMFGSGGVEVEAIGDVAFELTPLSRAEAESMLNSTWAGRRLRGYRNMPPADRAAVAEVILRVGYLAEVLPEVEEIEVNPLRALPVPDGGALALDVRLRVGARAGRP